MADKILMVLTSHDRLGESGHPTGFWYEEMAAPYRIFDEAGFEIVMASPKGGEPPHDPKSLEQLETLPEDVAWFLDNATAMEGLCNSVRLAEIDFSDFVAVFLPGGHGAVFDLPGDSNLIKILGAAADRGAVIGAVCHGPGGLVGARRGNGEPLISGYQVSGFTNGEEQAVELTKVVPFLLEDKLRALGGHYVKGEDFQPFAVRDRNLVTGQNPMSSVRTAELMLEALLER
ncbi:type 1 glutamine amidotransferase domain-containing protein [Thiorhodococcus mannitoliphagus]|uniref:Type 1 glutamine amidotransferase domain-containing protein n=1 Tax=Thiorhodococcus mannitoliphagus TaxID=329406 RepID=A0A6P1DWK4_9GAMM|nr:type 1 glutamine amidotransferase domain-containing protein [Thiorhodococcus mannitoliphagus]NEX21106.1 type 1 glutamine amidotransferase domain-containing protein [Thiorhodococcus mannitoliphagus]